MAAFKAPYPRRIIRRRSFHKHEDIYIRAAIKPRRYPGWMFYSPIAIILMAFRGIYLLLTAPPFAFTTKLDYYRPERYLYLQYLPR